MSVRKNGRCLVHEQRTGNNYDTLHVNVHTYINPICKLLYNWKIQRGVLATVELEIYNKCEDEKSKGPEVIEMRFRCSRGCTDGIERDIFNSNQHFRGVGSKDGFQCKKEAIL